MGDSAHRWGPRDHRGRRSRAGPELPADALARGSNGLASPRRISRHQGHRIAARIKGSPDGRDARPGDAITPSKVEAAYNHLLKEREIRENLHAMRSAGATLHYSQVDVSDERAFGNLLDAIYRDYGRLDGVIHGAGIIEDRLIDDKNPGSFARVFDTKVRSALVLSISLSLIVCRAWSFSLRFPDGSGIVASVTMLPPMKA